MADINTYLTFSGNCREAMNFYKQCLNGELTFQTIGESPMAKKMPPQMKDSILHATLTNDRLTLMGSDMVSEKGLVRGNAVSLMLNCNSEEEIKTYYEWRHSAQWASSTARARSLGCGASGSVATGSAVTGRAPASASAASSASALHHGRTRPPLVDPAIRPPDPARLPGRAARRLGADGPQPIRTIALWGAVVSGASPACVAFNHKRRSRLPRARPYPGQG